MFFKSLSVDRLNISPHVVGNINTKNPEEIERAINFFENQIVNSKIENAVIITDDGKIYHCSGDLNKIDSILILGEKLNGSIVTHNHPQGSDGEHTFSKVDQKLFLDFDILKLRGVEKNFVYEFNRDPNDLNSDEPTVEDFMNGYDYRHWDVLRMAKILKIGYRRWRRE